MVNLNTKLNASNTYDAIVIGSGMSGGWAAKELSEKGLNTLVLEKGRMVNHIEDYPTMMQEIKNMTLMAFFTSEKIGKNFLRYDAIPGEYIGCMPLNGLNSWTE